MGCLNAAGGWVSMQLFCPGGHSEDLSSVLLR